MPRRVQDIVPGSHRSIRDIPVEHTERKHHLSKATHRTPLIEKVDDIHIHRETREAIPDLKDEVIPGRKVPTNKMLIEPAPTRRQKKGGGLRWFIVTLVIIVIVGGIGFVASIYFSRATFTIVPKSIAVDVNGTYVAQHVSAPASATSADGLTYETITVRRTASTTVPASDGPTISTKAQGKITIYNAFSTNPQQLIAGSRLANSSGRIYRLTGTVTVPGMDAATPGSVSATIIADEPGALFNISKTQAIDDLKFLGYKGTSKYDAFYARLASEISGGYEGKKKTVDPAVLASTSAALKANLAQELMTSAEEAVPGGYIMYDSMNTTTFTDAALTGNDPTKAEISVTGIFNGIIFKESKLASRLASSQAIASFGTFPYKTPGLDGLAMTIANANDFSAERKTPLLVKGVGNFKVVGIIPVEEIRTKLAGVPLTDTQEVLQQYGPVIQSGSGELVPPWSKVPNDPERIRVIVKE